MASVLVLIGMTFALLSVLGAQPFGLEYAAALRMMALDIEGTEAYDAANVQCLAEQTVAGYANLERDAIASGSIGVPLALLASTAAESGIIRVSHLVVAYTLPLHVAITSLIGKQG